MTCPRYEEIVENTGVWHRLRGRKAVDHGTRHIEGIEVVLYNSEGDGFRHGNLDSTHWALSSLIV
jgi:hypothetical protein